MSGCPGCRRDQKSEPSASVQTKPAGLVRPLADRDYGLAVDRNVAGPDYGPVDSGSAVDPVDDAVIARRR
jgi:hypothetical protein